MSSQETYQKAGTLGRCIVAHADFAIATITIITTQFNVITMLVV